MHKIRALIVDDEPLARRGIQQLLASHADVDVVGECRDGREALASIDRLQPDLIFLDVQMPEVDGFALLESRRDAIPYVVFVTAYDHFAVKAFESQAVDYLVKPLGKARFDAMMARVRTRMQQAAALATASRLAGIGDSDDRRPTRGLERLIVPTATGKLVIAVDDVERIEADDYVAVIHARGKRHLVRESLNSLEERLDSARFLRVHRSAIVPLDRVREIVTSEGGQTVALMRDGSRVPVSRRRRMQLFALLRSARS